MNLKLDEFIYDLPEDRIAKQPPKERGQSKLLHYNKGRITHNVFTDIPNLIPHKSLLVFNDTKVIPARIIMHKETGARIEIFLLEPIKPSSVHEEVMNATETCAWKCLIGNAKKWKQGSILSIKEVGISAVRISEDSVRFDWDSELTFSDMLVEIGKIPLPPYIDREVNQVDTERYQTVYSKMKGAVAAPTAGLHFTDEILSDLELKDVKKDFLTLHVSAGTFQPIKSDNIQDHPMHNEQILVSRKNIENLIDSNKTITVGTTSMRTLESLYWFGVKLKKGINEFHINQKDPYQFEPLDWKNSLQGIIEFMDQRKLDKLRGQTEIFLYPGYEFKMCDGLITNYHMPGSTLILLVAAFIGNDWRKVYEEALANDYQFLSYGDSSLLLK